MSIGKQTKTGKGRPAPPRHARPRTAAKPRPDGRPDGQRDGRLWFYGRHAVEAALLNPRRYCHELRGTSQAIAGLSPQASAALHKRGLTPAATSSDDLTALMPPGSVHQGLALRVEPLDQPALEDVAEFTATDSPALVVVLDHVTDPQNVGAVFRSAAAFGASAIITQDRHSPPESAALAKAASGALEILPWVRTVNLSRSLESLAANGFWRIGLAGEADQALAEIDLGSRVVLVLGAEGAGLRQGIRSHCDLLARLPIRGVIDSLNVSNAAAVALYELARRQPFKA